MTTPHECVKLASSLIGGFALLLDEKQLDQCLDELTQLINHPNYRDMIKKQMQFAKQMTASKPNN